MLSNTNVSTNDVFITGTGNDTVNAGGGDDRIETGDGNDILDGGAGGDTLTGGLGNDTFQFVAANNGSDVIMDFALGDRIKVTDATFTKGLISQGNGTALLANQAQVSADGLHLYIGTNATAGAEIDIRLNTAVAGRWQVNGDALFLNTALVGSVSVSGSPTEGASLVATDNLSDADGLGTLLYQWQSSSDGISWSNVSTDATLDLTEALVGRQVKVVTSYTDGYGVTQSVTSNATAAVANINDTPTLTTLLADQSATAHFLFSHTLVIDSFSDVDSGDSLSLSARLADGNALPAWLHFDSATGAFSGTPTYQYLGNLDIIVTATDSGGANVTDTFTLAVSPPPAITGTAISDVLIGTNNPDTLNSGDGNDFLNGGRGADLMVGGVGNDVYVVDHRFDQITELADGGFDSVSARASHVLADNVENLYLTGSVTLRSGGFFSRKTTTIDLNSDGTGNASDNLLRGNRGHNQLDGLGGNDTLLGGAGADVLQGGTGADRLVGGAGADVFVFAAGDGGTSLAAADMLYDFEDGIDRIALAGGLDFVGLSISQGNGIDTAASNTVIRAGSEECLVVLLNVSPGSITAADFYTLGI